MDCDVLQADGGTRTASITGGFVALHLALQKAMERKQLRVLPIRHFVSAISVGIVQGQPRLDLNYLEDFAAQTDMNCVVAEDGRFIEIQGTAEREPFAPRRFGPDAEARDQGDARAGRRATEGAETALRQLLLATNNAGKLAELRALLAELPMELLSPVEAGIVLEVEEDGATYAENARKKAEAGARLSKMPALGDDSGMEVAALGGRPGIGRRGSPATRTRGTATP